MSKVLKVDKLSLICIILVLVTLQSRFLACVILPLCYLVFLLLLYLLV